MDIACIDLEGVLAPEMWPYIGKTTGIAELKTTTREEPDYARLMQHRLALLRRNALKLSDIQKIVANLKVFDGATDFLDELGAQHRVIIVSDAFLEMARHFTQQLGNPEIQCHRFNISTAGYINSCCYLPRLGKEETVHQLQSAGHSVLAVGDAFNDLAMLRKAELGFLFKPSRQTQDAARDIQVANNYSEVLSAAKLSITSKIESRWEASLQLA